MPQAGFFPTDLFRLLLNLELIGNNIMPSQVCPAAMPGRATTSNSGIVYFANLKGSAPAQLVHFGQNL
jgi:hypothetical protein